MINGEFGGVPSLLPVTFCGENIGQEEVCVAVAFLSTGGGGINNFKRQGMAALLNCEAFVCSPEIQSLVLAGSDACAAGDSSYDFGAAGSILDEFNNSGDSLELPLHSPSAQPKYCSAESDKKVKNDKQFKQAKKTKKKAK